MIFLLYNPHPNLYLTHKISGITIQMSTVKTIRSAIPIFEELKDFIFTVKEDNPEVPYKESYIKRSYNTIQQRNRKRLLQYEYHLMNKKEWNNLQKKQLRDKVKSYLMPICEILCRKGIKYEKDIYWENTTIELSDPNDKFRNDLDDKIQIWKETQEKTKIKKVRDSMCQDVLRRESSTNNSIAKSMAKLLIDETTDEEIIARNNDLGIKDDECYICGKKIQQKDIVKEHFVPSSCSRHRIYGSDNKLNIFNACNPCNSKKGGKTPFETCKMISEVDKDKAERFSKFYSDNKQKLQCDDTTIQKIEKIQKVAALFHKDIIPTLCMDLAHNDRDIEPLIQDMKSVFLNHTKK